MYKILIVFFIFFMIFLGFRMNEQEIDNKTKIENLSAKNDSLVLILKKVDSLQTILKCIETSNDDTRKFKLILFKKVQQSYTDLDKIGKKIDGVGAVGLALLCFEAINETYPELFNASSTITGYSVTNGDTTYIQPKVK